MINPAGLDERQRAVLYTMRMRLTREQALKFLAEEGFPMSFGTLWRIKDWLKKTKLKRLHRIAAYEFRDQHLERIENCETIERLMWKNYEEEESPYLRTKILKEIKEIQPYLSSYYETTKELMMNTDSGSGSGSGSGEQNITISKEQVTDHSDNNGRGQDPADISNTRPRTIQKL